MGSAAYRTEAPLRAASRHRGHAPACPRADGQAPERGRRPPVQLPGRAPEPRQRAPCPQAAAAPRCRMGPTSRPTLVPGPVPLHGPGSRAPTRPGATRKQSVVAIRLLANSASGRPSASQRTFRSDSLLLGTIHTPPFDSARNLPRSVLVGAATGCWTLGATAWPGRQSPLCRLRPKTSKPKAKDAPIWAASRAASGLILAQRRCCAAQEAAG